MSTENQETNVNKQNERGGVIASSALFSVYVSGMDEYHAAENKEAAEKECRDLREFARKEGGDDLIDIMDIKVVEWPFDAESHAAGLERARLRKLEGDL